MVVKVQESDGVKVYNVTAGKNLPAWLKDKRRKHSLSKDESFAKHVELIQDFAFPSACHKIKHTRDGQYIFASGIHAPRVKVYDLNNLSLKFERHFDSEVVDFQILSEDYSKCVFLCGDRTVNFQTRMGKHCITRVPKAGRDLSYLDFNAELIIVGSAPEIWRIDLSEGRFLSPLAATVPAVNAVGVCPVHGMVAVAGEDGALECFDFRASRAIGHLDVAAALGQPGEPMTALRFDDSGLNLAAGMAGGKVAVFDLRKPAPLTVKDHMYDCPIKDIKFHRAIGDHDSQQRVVSTDSHVVKIWDMHTGSAYTNIEPEHGEINDVCLWPGSGLMFVAGDFTQIGIYFAPSLGPAPRWCSFLEGIVEELEETSTTTVYDDYRFVTKADLERLELDHLLGTAMVRAYMHGFFIDNRLYHKAKNRKDPFAYEVYRQKRIAEKVEEERQSRISLVRLCCHIFTVKRLPKVNAQAHVRLQAAEMAASGTEKKHLKREAENAAALLQDDRFTSLFEDKDFEIDERSQVYRELHPNAGSRKRSAEERLIEEHFQEVQSGDEDDVDGDDAGASGEEADEDAVNDPDDDDEDEGGGDDQVARAHKRARMYASKGEQSAALFSLRKSTAAEGSKPLAQRVSEAGLSSEGRSRVGGNRELTFSSRRAGDNFEGAYGSGRGKRESSRDEDGGRATPRGRGGRGRARGRGSSFGSAESRGRGRGASRGASRGGGSGGRSSGSGRGGASPGSRGRGGQRGRGGRGRS